MSIDLLDEMLELTEAFLREPAPAPPTRAAAPPRPGRAVPKRWAVAAPRPERRRPTLAVGVLVIVLLWLVPVAPAVRVHVNGRLVVMHARDVSVATVLRRAAMVPSDGPLLSVVTHEPIDAHFDKATVLDDGRPVAMPAVVRSGARLDVRNGRPVVETAEHRTVEVPGDGLPAIEYGLWHVPRAGTTDQLVGPRSGEVVSEVPMTAPAPAAPATEQAVGLTFDDGPNPDWTPIVLDILRKADIKATFCVVGYAVKRYPELVRRIVAEGHTLCNHTMHHVQLLGRQSPDHITQEIRDDSDAIEQAAGVRPEFFRAPGGTWAPNLVDEVHRQGMRALGWNVDPADYTRPGAAAITTRILAQLRPGAVILMHDGGGNRGQTVAQLQGLIDRLRALGYTFRVPERT